MEIKCTKEQRRAIDEERTRIARDLHDGPIQTMTHLGHKLEFVQCLLAKQAVEHAQEELQQVRALLETCLHALRYDISSLMTTQISAQNIGDVLQALLNEYQMDEPTVRLISTIAALHQLPATLPVPLFRFVQEALNNVRKHAHATEVVLRVQLHATSLLAEVCDNGIGLQTGQRYRKNVGPHMGMRIIRERLQEVGGTVEFKSISGSGTCVRAIFPLVVA